MLPRFKLAQIAIFLIIAPLLFSLFLKTTNAASFSVSYDINFTFKKDGSASVVQNITLKNLTADLYPAEYSLNIGSTKVRNIKGTDSLGAISIKQRKDKGSTVIKAALNDKVIGKNKKTKFTLTYTIKDLANKRGKIREILVPGITTSENLSSFNLTIKVPKEYGNIFSVNPTYSNKKIKERFNVYTFNKKDTPGDTIIAYFGDYQVISFSFKHKLSNPNFFNKEQKIVLPRDSDFQEINFTEISPRPDNIEVDDDGNYFANYNLAPGMDMEVVVSGFAKIDDFSNVPKSDGEVEQNLASLNFWESDSQVVANKAAVLSDSSEIYKFIVENFKFGFEITDSKLSKRAGASKTLTIDTSSETILSSEFVDLFIALARAKGIPTRQVIGFAFGGGSTTPTIVNEDPASEVLHTWAEYFDREQRKWVAVDPTWGATRAINYHGQVDPSHFALFMRGTSSTEPKVPNYLTVNRSDDVTFDVEPVDIDFNFEAKPKIELDMNKVVSGFPTVGKVKIINETGKTLRGAKLSAEAFGVKIIGDDSYEIGAILPYSEYSLNIKVRSGAIFESSKGSIVLALSGFDQGQQKEFKSTKDFLVQPFFSFNLPQIILILTLFVILIGVSFPLYKRIKTRLNK